MNAQSRVATSADGIPIHYDVQGNGAAALVFVHGWCCNRRYWDRHRGHFAPYYTVVALDLAGEEIHLQASTARPERLTRLR